MPAPNITYRIDKTKISDKAGFNTATVVFSADMVMTAYEVRATVEGMPWGLGVGQNVQSSAQTIPAGTEVSAAIYDTDLLSGDNVYRITIYAQSIDGAWNDTAGLFGSAGDEFYDKNGERVLMKRHGTTQESYVSAYTSAAIDDFTEVVI